MLAELGMLALTAAAAPARRLGYARNAVSLWSRHRRLAKAWAGHESNTRAFAAAIGASCSRRDTVWVLGAGTLADLPLAELSALFRQVLVFDIALLPGARIAARRFTNLTLGLADITGIVGPLDEWRPGLPLPVPSAAVLADLDPVPPDCVLSLNVLSQLPLLPLEYLRRRGIARAAAENFGRAVLRAHLDGLAAMGCAYGVVADRRRIWRSRAGEVVVSESATLDLTLPPGEREWFWPLAPRGEIDNETGLEVVVQAWRGGVPAAISSVPERIR